MRPSPLLQGDESDCRPWVAPTMHDEPRHRDRQATDEAEREMLERLRQEAVEAGRAAGYEEGLRQGREAVEEQVRRLAAIADRLAAPLAAVDEAVVTQLAGLARLMARHIVRREVSLDEGVVMAAVDKAVARLPLAARDVRIHLHPDDLAVVREIVARDEGGPPWQLIGDPLIERGGCRVETADSEVDATVESRLNALFYEMFGGTREGDDNGNAGGR